MNKNQIIYRLINTEFYEQYLSTVPHREFHDLSIVYYELDQDGKRGTIITNQDIDEQGISEQELYELAMVNTREWSPLYMKKVSDTLKEIGMEIEDLPEEQELYVITNEKLQFGAAAVLYKDVLDELAKRVGTDLYLIPSSEHEFLAVTVNASLALDDLQNLVHYVNATQVRLEDRLSNQVYYYDMTTQEITQATHNQCPIDSVREFDGEEEDETYDGDMQIGMVFV